MSRLWLFALSGLLYALMFPSLACPRGLGSLGFVFLLPALLAMRRAGLGAAALGGALFALVGYGLMNWWLFNYDPLAPLVVVLCSALFYALLFLAVAAALKAFGALGWLPALALWVGAEYLKTLGFMGYPFGIVGYSQYRFTALAQFASLVGVWGLSALALAPQFLAASAFGKGAGADAGAAAKRPSRANQALRATSHAALRALPAAAVILAVALWGGHRLASRAGQAAPAQSLRIALVQPSIAPHEEDPDAYRRELDVLIEASSTALARGADLVVWPETAFVPSIAWHERYRTDAEVWPVVERCLAFIGDSHADFLIGNNQGELEVAPDGRASRVDYNAVLSFRRDRPGFSVYRKLHLVPFSEYFPFERSMPGLYRFLTEREGSFWRPGGQVEALRTSTIAVATPICFEDAFGDLTRRLSADGASLVVPVVNDAWSRSAAAEYQHAACSVFRAIETGLPVARCANSGLTCVISPWGGIEAALAPFSSGVLVEDVALRRARPTLYAKIGDLFARICLILGAASLLFAAARTLAAAITRGGRRAAAGARRRGWK